VTDAVDVAIQESKDQKPTFEFAGQTWTIVQKPSTLMIAEFARTESSDDPEAMGIIAEFFDVVLGDEYPRFRKVAFRSDEDVVNLIPVILEKTVGRPTE
jgi:hypothetical protein